MKRLMRYASTASASAVLVAVALASPAAATMTSYARTSNHVTTTTGTVIAKDAHRHTLVVASAFGVVHTVRLSGALLSSAHVGERISARTTSLADGTVRTSALRRAGHATRAKIRATIVWSHSGKLLVSAGGSVFAISTGRVALSASSTAGQTGENVDVTVGISANGLDQISEQNTGQSNLLSLDGILSAVSTTSLTIAVEEGASTTVAIPATLTLPSSIAVGDQIEIVVAYANQAFSLVTIKDDSLAANSLNQGVTEGDHQNLQVEGQVIVASSTSLTIQPGDAAAAVTIAVPSTVDVSAVLPGDQVQAEVVDVAGVLTLSSVEVHNDGAQGSGDQASSEIAGTLTSLSAGVMTVTTSDSSTMVTAAVPTTLDTSGLAVGARVHLVVAYVAGVLTVTDVSLADTSGNSVSN